MTAQLPKLHTHKKHSRNTLHRLPMYESPKYNRLRNLRENNVNPIIGMVMGIIEMDEKTGLCIISIRIYFDVSEKKIS